MWTIWMNSMRKFYEDDPADKGTGGGGEDDKGDGKGDDKGDHKLDVGEAIKNLSDDEVKGLIEGRTFNIKVNGTDKNVTLSEALKFAEKVGGADGKLREAADLRKSGAEGIAIKETLEAFKNGSQTSEDIKKFGELVGLDAKEVNEMLKTPEKKGGDPTPAGDSVAAILSPEDRQTLDEARAASVERADKKITEDVKKAVDKDEYFGKIIEETPEDSRSNRGDAIETMVRRAVRTKILASPYTKETFGAGMITAAIQEVRAELDKYGIPSKTSKQVPDSILAALGSTVEFPAEIHSDKLIERVSSDDPGYEDNFAARMAQKQLAVIRNK